MTDTEYMDRAEALLRAVEQACDRINDESDADIDNQRVGGMITLTLHNRTQIIINLQKPLQEVWMAAKAGGLPPNSRDKPPCSPPDTASVAEHLEDVLFLGFF